VAFTRSDLDEAAQMTPRINAFHPLCPRGNYPVFDFQVSVKGTEYDLVLPNHVADQLRQYCCQDKHHRLDRQVGGSRLRDLRARLVRMTTCEADRERRLFAEFATDTDVGVFADKLRETARYYHLLASAGIASRLCVDADAERLPHELASYVRLHKLVLFESGGFELLVARFDSVRFDDHALPAEPPEVHKRLRFNGSRSRRSFPNA
jgi:hypothetical protein